MLDNEIERLTNNGTDIADPLGATIDLSQDFLDPNLINPNGVVDPITGHVSSDIDAILKGVASGVAQETDLLAVRDVRNLLFGPPGAGGTDLIARDIQRARDHGIGTYNQLRKAYGLKPVKSFADITSNVAVQQKLQATYGTVDQIDPFEGILAEDHVAGADVGPTAEAILVDQFTRLRDGDRFFYLNQTFTSEENDLITGANTLAKMIKKNTNISNLQSNVFFFTSSISGRVFDDDNGNGVQDTGEEGIAGVTVNLNDDSGKVIATTITNSNGKYSFTEQSGIPGTGNFTVSVVLPQGYHLTSAGSISIALSRGSLTFGGESFGIDDSSSPRVAATVLPNALAASALSTSSNGTVGTVHAPAGATHEAAPVQSAVPVQSAANPAKPPDSAGNVEVSSVSAGLDGPAADWTFAAL
jgi:hypothetical protein